MVNYTAEIWKDKLIYEDQAIETFKKWGYYQQKLRING